MGNQTSYVQLDDHNGENTNRADARKLHALGLKFRKEKDLKNAISAFSKAAKIREEHWIDHDEELGDSYTKIARCYFELRDFKQALIYYKKALNIIYRTLYLLNIDLSKVYYDLSQYSEGLIYLKRASELRENYLVLDKALIADELLTYA